jgi:hypothetical protein
VANRKNYGKEELNLSLEEKRRRRLRKRRKSRRSRSGILTSLTLLRCDF